MLMNFLNLVTKICESVFLATRSRKGVKVKAFLVGYWLLLVLH